MALVAALTWALVTSAQAGLTHSVSAGRSGFLQLSASVRRKMGSRASAHMEGKRREDVSEWREYELDGHIFFVDVVTGAKQWIRPSGSVGSFQRTIFKGPENYVRQDLIESSKEFTTLEYHRMERDIKEWDITLAFQGDVSRLAQLAAVAEKWQGPISASILLLQSDTPQVDKIIEESWAIRKYVDINLCVAREKWAYYPVNKLRNHANKHARTEYLFIVDGDEDPVQSMDVFSEDLQSAILSEQADPKKTAFVVTSWQWGEVIRPAEEYPRSKADLSTLSQKGKAVCKAADFPQAYMPMGVELEEWISRRTAKEVPWHDRYEPYMVVHRATIGSFDERFVGWGGNKAIHAMKMQLERIKWVLLPHAFTFTNQSIVEDNAGLHSLPADPDLPERAAMELGYKFGCSTCTYKECVQNCLGGLDVQHIPKEAL